MTGLRTVIIRDKKVDREYVQALMRHVISNIEYTDTAVTGKFHQWISEYGVNEQQEVSRVLAVVELADGTVDLFEHDLIRFIEQEDQ